MSRAFVREDSEPEPQPMAFNLPSRDAPEFLRAAATALLEGARRSDVAAAEAATGMRWGDTRLVPMVRAVLADAERQGDERLMQVAERFLKHAGA
ncbi:MAG TPA: hypothetical protein VHW65_11340 [Gemmatimonadales bacterium]|nr:hypothetical protein [Gemmatimonadales bacterium]